jgi:hypothetical protein
VERYEIEVVGQLGIRRARALGCDRVGAGASGGSVLTCDAVDSAALYGVLARLRDAGLVLVAIRRIDESRPDADQTAQEQER